MKYPPIHSIQRPAAEGKILHVYTIGDFLFLSFQFNVYIGLCHSISLHRIPSKILPLAAFFFSLIFPSFFRHQHSETNKFKFKIDINCFILKILEFRRNELKEEKNDEKIIE